MELQNKWNDLAIKAILLSNNINITEVNNFEIIKSLFFDKEKYQSIISLLEARDFETLEEMEIKTKDELSEYLDIIKFSDQTNKSYIATIYDSNELWQYPKLIDIIHLQTPIE
jgi:hypothetical protein